MCDNTSHRLFASIGLLLFACSTLAGKEPHEIEQPPNRYLTIGPVSGLTTAWQIAPTKTMIPLGTTAQFKHWSHGIDLIWQGAIEVLNDGDRSVAEHHFDAVGHHEVSAEYTINSIKYREKIDIQVVDIAIREIEISPIFASVDPVVIDEDDLNSSAEAYYRGESIANLRRVSKNHYRTSIFRSIDLKVKVSPVGFAPLIEWRRSDKAEVVYGTSAILSFQQIGTHSISVGLLADPRTISIETYTVDITSHISNRDEIPTGEPVTFTAVTHPPGYEDDIVWLGSTKYGTCEPVMGVGPDFTVRFEDTWGSHPTTDESFQWLGIKADHVTFNQDKRVCAPPGGITHVRIMTARRNQIFRVPVNGIAGPHSNFSIKITNRGPVQCQGGKCGPGTCRNGDACRWDIEIIPQGLRDPWHAGIAFPESVCNCELRFAEIAAGCGNRTLFVTLAQIERFVGSVYFLRN